MRLSAGSSRTTMHEALRVVASELGGRLDALDWPGLRYSVTQALRSRLAARYAPASANKMLAAMRGVLKEAMRLGRMTVEDYTHATDLPRVRGSRLPAGRALSADELRALFAACPRDTAKGCRDAALLVILYAGGLRRAEAVGLDLSDYDDATGTLKVRGKGERERTALHAAHGSREVIRRWLEHRGQEPGPLLVPIDKAGRVRRRRLSPHAVLLLVRRLASAAGILPVTPHSLRRSFVSDLLDANVDITTVAAMAGHAQVTTTARYDRRGERAKRTAAQHLRVPYAGGDLASMHSCEDGVARRGE